MKADKGIQQDVLAELDKSPGVRAAEIGVAVHHGVATLTGQVATWSEKWVAEHIASGVPSVKAVANDLEVRIPGVGKPTDADIAETAANVLSWDAIIPESSVRVIVSDGWVTLEGHVDWQYQKDAAERDVASLTGVKGVSNQINVAFKSELAVTMRAGADEWAPHDISLQLP